MLPQAARPGAPHPCSEEVTSGFDLTLQNETKGFIGQRLDADAGLLYLNARYYDPKLGMFLQPDWWEVTKPGVGTNRYGYSGGDPVNGSDPGGHSWLDRAWDSVFGGGSFNRTFGDRGSVWSDKVFGNSFERSYAKFYDTVERNPGAGQNDYPKSTYSNSKAAFFDNARSDNGRAASGDFIFDVFSGGSSIAAKFAIKKIGIGAGEWFLGKGVGAVGGRLTAQQIGKLGEDAVRAANDIGPKVATIMFGRTRVPDGLLPDVLSEIKNVAKLAYTRQLRDYAAFAKETSRTFDLYVRRDTILSGPLQDAVVNGAIKLLEIPF